MRDAVTFEGLGIPTVILVNDVFAPIANATSELLRLPRDYVARNIVWMPHPTSILTESAAAALIDGRIDEIRAAFLGSKRTEAIDRPVEPSANGQASNDALAIARATIAGLAESLRVDGADLIFTGFDDGVITGELRIGDVTCDDGTCIMPADALARTVEAMLRPKLATLRRVDLREVRTF